MVRTVYVSRVFRVDVESQPEVVEELRRLAARGFDVLGPIDLSPVAAAAPEPEPEPTPRPREVIDELKRLGLGTSGVAALVGVSAGAISNWKSGRHNCDQSRLGCLERLLERAKSGNLDGLKAEARGARRAVRLASGKRRRIYAVSESQRATMVDLRSRGSSVSQIAEATGLSQSCVRRNSKL
jgi:predicted transcriptional regulator